MDIKEQEKLVKELSKDFEKASEKWLRAERDHEVIRENFSSLKKQLNQEVSRLEELRRQNG